MDDFPRPRICWKIQNITNYFVAYSNEFNDNMALFLHEIGLEVVNIVNRSRPRLTSCLLKKQARHQCDVCTPSSGCLVVYNQFVMLKKCMAAPVNKFLRSLQENINNWKFESSWYEQYKWRPFWKRSARQVPRLAWKGTLRLNFS